MTHLTVSILVQMGEEGALNGKNLKMVVMPVEQTNASMLAGGLREIFAQVLLSSEDWCLVDGAPGQIVTLPSGARGRIEKVTPHMGNGVLLDLGPAAGNGESGSTRMSKHAHSFRHI